MITSSEPAVRPIIAAGCLFGILIVILVLIASHEIPRRRAITDSEKEKEREAQDTWDPDS